MITEGCVCSVKFINVGVACMVCVSRVHVEKALGPLEFSCSLCCSLSLPCVIGLDVYKHLAIDAMEKIMAERVGEKSGGADRLREDEQVEEGFRSTSAICSLVLSRIDRR